jgi:predicted DNA-binding transcriptional regulator AlpA
MSRGFLAPQNTPVHGISPTGVNPMGNSNIPSPVDTQTAAQMIGVEPRTLDNWRSAGIGPKFLRISAKLIRYDPRDIEAWKDDRRVSSTSQQIAA